FCEMKFSSFVLLEQLNIPKACEPCLSTVSRSPAAAWPSASSHSAGRSRPPPRISGALSLAYFPVLVLVFMVRGWLLERLVESGLHPALYAEETRAQAGRISVPPGYGMDPGGQASMRASLTGGSDGASPCREGIESCRPAMRSGPA